jgi:hypothetical protein
MATRDKNKDLEDAIQILERHPRFPHVWVKGRNALEEIKKAHAHIRAYTPEEHLALLLLEFDTLVGCYMELIDTIDMLNALLDHLESWTDSAWTQYAGGPPEVKPARNYQDQKAFETILLRREFWVKAAYQQLADLQLVQAAVLSDTRPGLTNSSAVSTGSQQDHRYSRTKLQPARWDRLQITFLSDYTIQIESSGEKPEVWGYAEMGLQDQRTKSPNLVWQLLRRLAELDGQIREDGASWKLIEKRMQRLRRFLVKFFNLPGDPIPFAKGNGYRTRFTIRCGPSYKV